MKAKKAIEGGEGAEATEAMNAHSGLDCYNSCVLCKIKHCAFMSYFIYIYIYIYIYIHLLNHRLIFFIALHTVPLLQLNRPCRTSVIILLTM